MDPIFENLEIGWPIRWLDMGMELRISDAAKDVVRKKGGRAAIDFIAPIG